MVIITNGTNATMYYSNSQWFDAEDSVFPPEDWGFRVPNSTLDPLGTQGTYDPETGEFTPGTPPMTQAQVAAIATETLFQPETSVAE